VLVVQFWQTGYEMNVSCGSLALMAYRLESAIRIRKRFCDAQGQHVQRDSRAEDALTGEFPCPPEVAGAAVA
jgi:hypothetical protein